MIRRELWLADLVITDESQKIRNFSVNLNAICNLFSRESLLDAVGGGGDGLGVETGLLLDDS